MEALTRFRAVVLTVPIALVLWVLTFLAAGAGHGLYLPLFLFYAPIAAVTGIGLAPFVGGPALHLGYAAVTDMVRARRLPARYLGALAVAHYAAVAYAATATDEGREAFSSLDPHRWRVVGVWIAVGVAVFVAWQVALARSLRRRPPMVS